MNVLVDVEDLFVYSQGSRRPSGIQRVVFEIGRALAETDAAVDNVHFLRHRPGGQAFQVVSWGSVAQLFATLTDADLEPVPAPAEPAEPAPEPRPRLRRAARAAIHRLPPNVHLPLLAAIGHQRAALGSAKDLLAVALAAAVRPLLGDRASRMPAASALEPAEQDAAEAAAEVLDCETAPGDVLLMLGAPWFHPNYAALVARAKRERGLRFALLVYDLIPVRRPEWCVPGLPGIFSRFMDDVLPLADAVLAISRATARDVARYVAERGALNVPAPVVVPLGSGFGAAGGAGCEDAARRALPAPGTYALSVGTIEARKNHALLFRLWRRLLETMPSDAVPMLVLAGAVGWLVADLMGQLRNADMLGGRIVLIEEPTDAELQRLYAGCRFTVYPSFYEGWGLPVSESLAFGRPCFVSSATSLPEAGGTLARYFDPENGEEAYRLIRHALEHPDEIARWQARVAREFRPVSWRRAAAAVLDAVRADQSPAEVVSLQVAAG